MFHARLRIRRFGHNTLARAACEALRSYRQVTLLERGIIGGYGGKRRTASQKIRCLKHGIDQWPIENDGYGLIYLKIMMSIEAFLTLIYKKAKGRAVQDRIRHWLAEADNLRRRGGKAGHGDYIR